MAVVDILRPAPELPLTDECRHYTRGDQVPRKLFKYWKSRYDLFYKYDDDICMTDDAWFGVTPQAIAEKIAADVRPPVGVPAREATIVDLFAGVGGNTIAFALSHRWARVVAIERDPATLACAQHNAAVNGLPDDAITWVLGDCFDFVARLRRKRSRLFSLHPDLRLDLSHVVFFASPPWGGVSYTAQAVFDLSTMHPYSLQDLRAACVPQPHALYLPRTSNLQQLADAAPADAARFDVVHYAIHGFSKALVAYYPAEPEDEGDAEDGTDNADSSDSADSLEDSSSEDSSFDEESTEGEGEGEDDGASTDDPGEPDESDESDEQDMSDAPAN